jgi:alanine racemase
LTNLYAHTCSTGDYSIMQNSSHHLVRVGTHTYGLWKSAAQKAYASPYIQLRPVLALKAQLIDIREVPRAWLSSYNLSPDNTTRDYTRIAWIALGYADGYKRILSGKSTLLVEGQPAPVGTIESHTLVTDITAIAQAVPGCVATIIGHHPGIGAEELAVHAGTSHNELLTSLSASLPRLVVP